MARHRQAAGIMLLAHACAQRAFVHPGVLVDAAHIATMQAHIEGGIEPQASFFVKANSSTQGSLAYKPFGPPPGGVITCGSYDKPNIGCGNETSDADAAYLHSLFFAITGDVRHASLAREIIALYTGPGGLRAYADSNAPLQAGWCSAKWTRGAELLRSTPGSGWSTADSAAFNAMMYGIHLPLIYPGSGANGNWELSMIEGMMGIAVFSENSTLLAHAADMWRQRTPAYFYNIVDGDWHLPLPRGANHTTWYNQTVFNASTNGVCQETCRDFGHMQMGFAACINAAETAFIQGVDLYGEQTPRISAAAEFAAQYLLGEPAQAYLCSGAGINLSLAPTFDIAYAHLHGLRGVAMPLTWQQITMNVRPRASQDEIVSVYETLTHGLTAPGLVQ